MAGAAGSVRFAGNLGQIELDPATESADDPDDNEEGSLPDFRNAKLDINENMEVVKNLNERVQTMRSLVVGGVSTPVPSRNGPVALDPTSSGAGPSTGTRIGNFGANPAMNAGNYEYTNFVPMLAGSNTPGLLNETSPSDGSSSIASPSTQSSQTWFPVRPQASRRQSEASFKVPVAQDDSYDRIAPFSLVHRGEFFGPGNVLHALHSVRLLSFHVLQLLTEHILGTIFVTPSFAIR